MNTDVLKFCELAYNYDVKHPAKIHKYHEMVLSTLLHGQFKGEEQTLESFFVDDGAYKDKRLNDCYICVEGVNGWWGYQLNLNNGIVQYYIDMLLCQEKSRQIMVAQQNHLWERITTELPPVFVYKNSIYWVNSQSPETRGSDAPIRIIDYSGSINNVWHTQIALNDMIAMVNGEFKPLEDTQYLHGGINHYEIEFNDKIYTFVCKPSHNPYTRFICVEFRLAVYDNLGIDKRSIYNSLIDQFRYILASRYVETADSATTQQPKNEQIVVGFLQDEIMKEYKQGKLTYDEMLERIQELE